MRFSIAGKVYTAAAMTEITLRDILLFEQQSKDLGIPVTWSEANGWVAEIDALKTDEEKSEHPKSLLLMAIGIWAGRRMAGDPVTFSESIDFSMDDLAWLPDPEDHKKPANPQKARPGSGRAAAKRPAAKRAAAKRTSARPSTAG